MNLLNLIPNDPAVLASISVGQLLSIPAIRTRFTDGFISTLQEHQLTMTLDRLEPAFLFLMLKDFLQKQKEVGKLEFKGSGKSTDDEGDLVECPFCKHVFFKGD